MQRMKLVGLALVVVLALSAVVASAASAEGPVWQVKKVELSKSTETRNLTASIKSAQFTLTAEGIMVINCTSAGSTGTIIGGSPGTDTAAITFSGCTIESHPECHVNSPGQSAGTIFTEAKTELVYLSSTSATNKKVDSSGVGSHLGDLFSPKSGTTFVTLEVTGNNCPAFTKGTNKVTGNIVAAIEPSETEATSGTLNFPSSKIEKYWTRSGGTIHEHEASLNVFGIIGVKQVGEETVSLSPAEEFGAWL
jgi:hypothetical protein